MSLFRKMPIVLSGIVLLLILTHRWISIEIQSVLYALSLSIISLMIAVLPFIIFILLFKTAASLGQAPTLFIVLVFTGVCISNFIATIISCQIGSLVYRFDLHLQLPHPVDPLIPAWNWTIPHLISNDKGMFAGLISGILCSLAKPAITLKIANSLDQVVNKIFTGIVLIMPVFITGFVIKLIHDQTIYMILSQYAAIVLSIVIALIFYLSFLYLVHNRFHWSGFSACIKNMLPAAITGIGTMSSAASMPFTIIGTEKNSRNPSLVRAIIPATVNIHLIGDCFAIPILAFSVLKTFGFADPSFNQYFIFALFFVLAKFSAGGVPAGGIIGHAAGFSGPPGIYSRNEHPHHSSLRPFRPHFYVRKHIGKRSFCPADWGFLYRMPSKKMKTPAFRSERSRSLRWFRSADSGAGNWRTVP